MKPFKDTEGTEWLVKIDVATIKRVRDTADVDLLSIGENPTLHAQLQNDPIFLVDLLYVVCRPQADERGITDVQFGERMAGDAIDAAVEAFLVELVNFFPKVKRAPLEKAVEKAAAAQRIAMARATTEIDSLDVQKLLDEALTRGSSSTSAPASPG